jgi:hypothetical protein
MSHSSSKACKWGDMRTCRSHCGAPCQDGGTATLFNIGNKHEQGVKTAQAQARNCTVNGWTFLTRDTLEIQLQP